MIAASPSERPSTPQGLATNPRSLSPSRESLRLLLVEDSRPDRVLLMRLLRDTPFEATSVERLRDAIDRCRERDSIPDVILLDLSLPDAAGLEAVAGLRAQASVTSTRWRKLPCGGCLR